MKHLVLFISILCTEFLNAQVFPIKVDLQFGHGYMAMDADEFTRVLESQGLSKLPERGISVTIKSHSDCPSLEGNRKNIAMERADYCENILHQFYPGVEMTISKEMMKRESCAGASPDANWTKVTLLFESSATNEPVIPVEPQPEAIPVDSAKTEASLNTLSQLNVGESLVLEGLNFQPGKHRILNEAKPVLKKLLLIMQENPTLKIEIQGHVCCGKKGGEDGVDEETGKYNLSWTRAQFVYDYLIEHGIDASRLSYKGYAMSMPLVYPEKTIQDQIKNRRVEVLITGK